jgi:hypothetical protein
VFRFERHKKLKEALRVFDTLEAWRLFGGLDSDESWTALDSLEEVERPLLPGVCETLLDPVVFYLCVPQPALGIV